MTRTYPLRDRSVTLAPNGWALYVAEDGRGWECRVLDPIMDPLGSILVEVGGEARKVPLAHLVLPERPMRYSD